MSDLSEALSLAISACSEEAKAFHKLAGPHRAQSVVAAANQYTAAATELTSHRAVLVAAPQLFEFARAALRALTPTDPSKFSADDERRRIATARTLLSRGLDKVKP